MTSPTEGLTEAVRSALHCLVWGVPGQSQRREVSKRAAAEYAGISDRALRLALNKPAVWAEFERMTEQKRANDRETAARRKAQREKERAARVPPPPSNGETDDLEGWGAKSAATLPVVPRTRYAPLQELEVEYFSPYENLPEVVERNSQPWHPSLNMGGVVTTSFLNPQFRTWDKAPRRQPHRKSRRRGPNP